MSNTHNHKGSLYKKYLVPLITTLGIAMLLGGTLISVLVYNQITKVEGQMKEQAKKEFMKDVAFKHRIYTNKVTNDISNKLSNMDRQLYRFSNAVNIRQKRFRALQKEIDALIQRDPNIMEFKIVNDDALATYTHCDPDRLYSGDLGILKPKELFKKENDLFVSKTYYDFNSGERYNYMARPISDFYGGINSYIMVRYNLDFIRDSISQLEVQDFGNFYVLDQNKVLIAQSSGDLSLNKYQQLSADEQTLLDTEEEGSVWGNNLLSFYKSELGWTFAMETPHSQAVKSVNAKVDQIKGDFNKVLYQTLTYMALGLLLICFMTTLIGIGVAKSVTKPVVELIHGVRKISDGDLDVKLHTKSDDEIGELTESFNDMAQSLKDYQIKVKEDAATIYEQSSQLSATNEELKSYAHSVSHDLKSPLRTLSGYVGLLDRRYGDKLDKDGKEYMQFLKDITARMHRTVEDILTYSKMDQNVSKEEFIDVDLNIVVDEVTKDLKPLIENNDAVITVTDLSTVNGHPTLLYSLFQNLITNSIKYRRDVSPYINIHHKTVGGYDVVSVEDNGTGMEEKFIPIIFKPFKRLVSKSKVEGTGIGLATVQKILKFHNAHIEVHSEVGKGTVFEIYFPRLAHLESESLNSDEMNKVPVSSKLKESIEYLNENQSAGNKQMDTEKIKENTV